MLIFGRSPTAPVQRGMPFPRIKYGLVVPHNPKTRLPMLHAVGCARLPDAAQVAASGLREIVWSTTYDEIEDHASREFGDDRWEECPWCGAVCEGDER